MTAPSTPKPRAPRRGRTATTGRDGGAVQSLSRGLALLERLAEAGRGVALTELAQQVGLAASTAHRLLNTLEQGGFVTQEPELGLWHIGVKAFAVGNAYLDSRDVVAQARPYLRRLMEQVGETVNLAIEDEGEVVYLAQVECREMMRMLARLGSRAPIHASGAGKAMMAWMEESRVNAFLHRHGLARLTPHTLDTPTKLHADLDICRRRGYAYDLDEHAIGLRCVASAIFNEHGEPIAALSISGPRARIPDERLPELGALAARTAAEITRVIGGRVPSATIA